MAIKKVAVIGSGVMGSGIAAQLANAGIEVELLDIVPKKVQEEGGDRDVVAKGAIEKMLKDKTNPFMHKKNAKLVRAGNIDDHMARISDCDLIIEVVLENPAIKSATFKKIDAHRKEGSIVASNTSTIPLHDLIADQSDKLKKDFVITHFFNPPRYMQLLELVTSEYNSPETVKEITRFMDEKMGKGVVHCNDTPGFIGNRIGTFWIQTAINEAHTRKLTVEEADAAMGKPIGVPKTGVFGLVDLVGLDLMPHISKSMTSKLPADDGYCLAQTTYPVIDKMIADGYTGRKGKGGFYRLDAEKNKLAVDLETGAERPAVRKVKSKSLDVSKKKGTRAFLETDDKISGYAWSVLKKTLAYTAEHAFEIGKDLDSIDRGMKLGYGWKYGPFELMDKIGVDYVVNRMKTEGEKVPALLEKAVGKSFYRTEGGKLQQMTQDGGYQKVERPEGVLLLSDVKRASKPVAKNMSASLWDVGDGVLCLEFHSKMNSINFLTLAMMNKACDIIGDGKGQYKGLVIHNEGDDFSNGANIGVALMAAKAKQYWIVDKMVRMGQEAYMRLKYSPFPVVAAPSGRALGGGCEVLLCSDHVQAHAETYPGLVEVGVGLLPAWGGSTELLMRAKKDKRLPGGPMPAVAKVFEIISTAKVGTSAQEAQDLYYLRKSDSVTMNKSRLLADAKAKCLELAKDYKPEALFDMQLPGPAGKAALGLAVDGMYLRGLATPYDVVVSDRVAEVLTGGKKADVGVVLTQAYIRELERKNFMDLLHDPRTLARVESILKAGKPLREKPIVGKSAAALRSEADEIQKDMFTKLFEMKPVAAAFNKVCPRACSNVNDNEPVLKKEYKPQVNWPKKG